MVTDEQVALWNVFGRIGTAELCDLELEGVENIVGYPPVKIGGGSMIIGSITPVRLTAEVQEPRPADVLRSLVRGRDILFMIAAGHRCAAIGDRLATLALSLGAVGVVSDGAVRDVNRLADLPLGVWSTGITPVGGGHPISYEAQSTPFTLFGQRWEEGDWYAQDHDGALRISVAGRRSLLDIFGDDVRNFME